MLAVVTPCAYARAIGRKAKTAKSARVLQPSRKFIEWFSREKLKRCRSVLKGAGRETCGDDRKV